MNRSLSALFTVFVSCTLLLACTDPTDPAPERSPGTLDPIAAPAAPPEVTQWAGRWVGPEGTYLEITVRPDEIGLELADLDGPKFYQGIAKGGVITFQRNGKTETIRATDGAGTGMKWLSEKTDCLVITVGSEGFCKG